MYSICARNHLISLLVCLICFIYSKWLELELEPLKQMYMDVGMYKQYREVRKCLTPAGLPCETQCQRLLGACGSISAMKSPPAHATVVGIGSW